MPRPKYPSDQTWNERRSPASFRVHTSIQNHPKMVEVFASNDLLATWLRLGLLCRDRGASETEDRIHMTRFDLVRVTQSARIGRAMALLGSLAGKLKWSLTVTKKPLIVVIHFRNFAKKQGFTPRKLRSTPQNARSDYAQTTRSPSPSFISSTEKHSTKTETEKGDTHAHGQKPASATDFRFGEFWKVYPRKVGRVAALRAWRAARIGDGLFDRVVADVDRRKRFDPDWMKERGRFIPHASTYLNGRRWEDEATVAEVVAPSARPVDPLPAGTTLEERLAFYGIGTAKARKESTS